MPHPYNVVMATFLPYAARYHHSATIQAAFKEPSIQTERIAKGRTEMPFTPFHMGAALIVKPGLNRNISVITFGLAQVAMDIEPGVGMLTGADVLHGPTHTLLGALVIAYLVMLIAPAVSNYLLRKWNKEVTHHRLTWLVQPETTSKAAVAVGALFGTLSHVVLDSLMHHDIHPLLPFSNANPLMGLVSHDGVYQLCAIAGVIGAVAWVVMQWFHRSTTAGAVNTSPDQLVIGVPKGLWTLWVWDMWATWVWILLISVGPSILFGSALFSVFALVLGVLMGVSSALGSRLPNSATESKHSRKSAIMLLVPVLMLVYVYKVDEQVPGNAKPITYAIESFQLQTGHYPASLDVLSPKHLAVIPNLRFTLEQPQITYRLKDGQPYLSIPSAWGDAFAKYEYDFESKAWKHQS
jgi:membrane-bound metal-dependent hydrolase YbcI (DUF457 family)